MLSALKKLTTSNNDTKRQDAEINRYHLQSTRMSKTLQNKFSKGVQYNMKIIIKGDRNVGKTCLFNRLQGRGFVETYTPTEEIQVACIQWNYKATDDIVKVEVWDVVDKGKKRRAATDNLKLGGVVSTDDATERLTPALDAEFLNVYKGANGIIVVMDITKNWTFEYVQRELETIPSTIPVLVLGNHCDMSHHRCVTADHVSYYLESVQRSSPARYTESSMSNGFGLKFLHKWFNLPFLQLQRETLLTQLTTNQKEIDITVEELDLYQQTDDSNYQVFIEKLTSHRRKLAESNSIVPSSSIVVKTQYSFPSANVFKNTEPIMMDRVDSLQIKSEKMQSSPSPSPSPSSLTSPMPPMPPPLPPLVPFSDNYRMSTKLKANTTNTTNTKNNELPTFKRAGDVLLKNIEEFVPDGHIDKSFLEESSTHTSITASTACDKLSSGANDSESDCENNEGNPLVSAFQEDFDPKTSFVSLSNRTTAVAIIEKPPSTFYPAALSDCNFRGKPDGGNDASTSTMPERNDSIKSSSNNSKSSSIEKKRDIAEKENKRKKNSKKRTTTTSGQCDDALETFLNCDYEAL